MIEDQKEALQRWREVKDMKVREEWAESWAAFTAQKSLDEKKEKSQKRKWDQTKEEAEAEEGDNRDKDPDYYTSEDRDDQSSIDPTYEPSRKEPTRVDKEGDQ